MKFSGSWSELNDESSLASDPKHASHSPRWGVYDACGSGGAGGRRSGGSQVPVKGAVRTIWGQRTQWEETKLEGEPPEIRVVGMEAGC